MNDLPLDLPQKDVSEATGKNDQAEGSCSPGATPRAVSMSDTVVAGQLPSGELLLRASADSISPTVTQSQSPGVSAETLDFTPTMPKAAAVVRTEIGDYEVIRELGRGGMGVVYHARHRQLNRDVALKMILAGKHAHQDEIQRFLLEARAVARFQHPNIVQIFDVGSRDGLPYFSLEYVDGVSLAEKNRNDKFSAHQAARLIETLARAMQYAHDHGVLHRDLKPGNVLLTSTNIPKISDFGLAKQLEDDDSASTRTGTVMGTPSYMSPEQARGDVRALGPATDQYSLGAILYELLVGRPPFIGSRPVETILRVLEGEPVAPRQLQPEVPIDLETICLKCLQKDASRRYRSCAELADDLGRFLLGEPIQARPVGMVERTIRWCKRNPKIAIPSGLLIIAVLSVTVISSWAALAMRAKNDALHKSNDEVTRQATIAFEKEKESRKQESIAKEKEAEARKQEGIARERSERLLTFVQKLYVEIRAIDVNQIPRMQERRDRLMKLTLPVLDDEIIASLPKEGDAVATNAALRFDVAKALAAQGFKEQAEQDLLELKRIFEQRVELMQGSDASRNNLAIVLRELGELKRDVDRDLAASLNYHQRELALAQEMVDDPRKAPDGRGGFQLYQSRNVLAIAHNGVGATYYRIGDPYQAQKHFELAATTWREILEGLDADPAFATLPPPQQASLRNEFKNLVERMAFARGLAEYRTGNTDDAESILRRAFEDNKQQFARDPKSPAWMRDHLGSMGIFAEFLAQIGKVSEAMPLLEQAGHLAEEVLAEAPNNFEFRRTAAVAFYRLAQWKSGPNPEDAAAWGQKMLDLRRKMVELEPNSDRRQLEWMLALAIAGDISQAEAIADKYQASTRPDSEMLVDISRALARCSTRAGEDARGALIQKAMDSLVAAVKLGYRDHVYLLAELDLQSLRDVPAFQDLVQRIRPVTTKK